MVLFFNYMVFKTLILWKFAWISWIDMVGSTSIEYRSAKFVVQQISYLKGTDWLKRLGNHLSFDASGDSWKGNPTSYLTRFYGKHHNCRWSKTQLRSYNLECSWTDVSYSPALKPRDELWGLSTHEDGWNLQSVRCCCSPRSPSLLDRGRNAGVNWRHYSYDAMK